MEKLSFKDFSTAVEANLNSMLSNPAYTIVRTKTIPDEMWGLYLNSYPKDVNGIFRERANYDCNCCKNFVRRVGNVLALNGNEVISVWDVEVPGYFQDVANALSNYAKSARIDNFYYTSEKIAGGLANIDNYDDKIVWDHFYTKIPDAFVLSNDKIGPHLGNMAANAAVLFRSLKELSLDSAETVSELIDQNSLYRGSEFKHVVDKFIDLKKQFDLIEPMNQEQFVYQQANVLGESGRIKNTVIGTLLSDLSDNVPLEQAVKKFEDKVAPTNYRRPTALVTPRMIQNAQETISNLGYEDSINRRFGNHRDVPADELIFTAKEDKVSTSVFDDMMKDSSAKVPKKLDKVETISMEKFITDVLPGTDKLELMFEPKFKSNLMTIVAPKHPSAKNMFKWNNGVSWAYNGDVTDTIKERVKDAGGNVTGDLRVSLGWFNTDDLDLSCIEPDGNEIYFGSKNSSSPGGMLDLDMNAFGKKDAFNPVENIFWADRKKMKIGNYVFKVNNFAKRLNERLGFTISVEYDGVIQNFSTDKSIPQSKRITCLTVNFDGTNFKVIDVDKGLSGNTSTASDKVWGINTNTFVPVKCVMNSPNHWSDNKVGNKHTFFIIDECKNEEPVRGFFNEYLNNELNEHRKVFEILGAKTKAEPSNDQISGLGFSETNHTEFMVRITGKVKRVMKVII